MGVNGIYGLSGSGLDIESLVKMGMSGKNKQYDKMEQQEIANTWLKEAYNDVYNDLTTYKYGTLSDYKMQSNMNAMQATSNNSSMVTATANGAAAAMNHTVTVTSVASNAYLQTAQKDSTGQPFPADDAGIKRENTKAKTSDMLADVMYKSYSVASATQDGNNWNFTYNIAGKDSPVNGSDVAISLKIKDSDAADAKEYTLSYTYDELFTGMASGTYTGYADDEKTLFEGGKTLYDLASAFAKTGANIQGGFDIANDAFSLYNKTSGKSNIIDLTVQNDDTATLFTNLRLGEVKDNTLSDAITFETPTAMKTTMESVDLTKITNSAQSVSLKDVLGLKATVNGNDVTVAQYNSEGTKVANLGTFSESNAVVFSMNLSNKADGSDGTTINFTLGELFDLSGIGTKTDLSANADLDKLAAKINEASNNAGLGITAAYDAIKDSFSLNNNSGAAVLSGTGTGDSKLVADSLVNSLNLVNSPNLSYKVADVSGIEVIDGEVKQKTLGKIFAISSTIKENNDYTYDMSVSQDNKTVDSISHGTKANYLNNTYANKTLMSFTIGDGSKNEDGSDKTVTVDLTYGDLINFGGMSSATSYTMNITNSSGTIIKTDTKMAPVEVQATQNDFSDLVKKINEATNGKVNVTAAYDSTTGQLSLLNPDGAVNVTDVSVTAFTSKLNLVTGDPSSIANKVSNGIKRVNEYNTENSIAAAVGLTAVKKDANTLTVKKSDGNFKDVAITDKALSFKVGNGTTEAEISLTYAELFDTTGSGTLKSTADYSTLVKKINGTDQEPPAPLFAGVTADYDAATGKFSLTNDPGDVTLTGVDSLASTLVANMGLKESEATKADKEAAGQLHKWAGTNASVTIDGKTYDNDTNKLTVAGVTYTFLDKTAGSTATVSVSQDTDKIVDYMKSFVEEYNKLLDSLNEKLSEKKYSDYKPLSKRQEDEMTEKQIEKWNEKAKSGLLYHNSDIQALVSSMREAIYTKVDAVDSQYNTLSSIGITTTNTKGHLTIDTDKLKKALADDPDCVYQLFASDQDSTYIAGSTNKNKITTAQSKMDYANTGVANRLYNVMTNHMTKISDIAGTSKSTDDQSYLGKLITNMQTKMKSFKTLMTSYENKLYKRYDAMEVALSKLNMQLGYISGSFS